MEVSPTAARAPGPTLYHGKGSMVRMIKDGQQKGHVKFAAVDVPNGSDGAKGWCSFPGHASFREYVLSLPENARCVYELVTPETRVGLWLDVEFLSQREADGEEQRSHLEAQLRVAIKASFGLSNPVLFCGKSTRQNATNGIFKHSYQFRIPSVVFPDNHKDGTLARWVAQFIQLTAGDAKMLCPQTKKHIVDAAVYSRSRCVRSCFSFKHTDKSRTCLRLMRDVASAPMLFEHGGDARVEHLEFDALAVEPCASYPWAPPPKILSGKSVVRCLGLHSAVGLSSDPTPEMLAIEAARKRAAENDAGPSRPRKRPANVVRVSSDDEQDRTMDAIEAISRLGAQRCENYNEWISVIFAMANVCRNAAARQAVIEWSKRAASFTDDNDVGRQFDSCQPRRGEDAGPKYGLRALRRWAKEDPFIVFKEDRVQVFDVMGVPVDRLEWAIFMRNVDVERTSWRCLVRVARALWPHQRDEVLQDVWAHMQRFTSLTLPLDALEHVWNLSPCACQAFSDNMMETIRKQLLWPEIVTQTVPQLLSEEFGTTLEAVAYTCDNVNSLDVTLVERDTDEPRTCRYKLRLTDGAISGSSVNILDLGFMFSQRDPTQLAPEYNMDAQMKWAEHISRIPEVRRNVRVVNNSSWFVYSPEDGIWEELPPRHARLKRYVSRCVHRYFSPLRTFLDYKSSFDPTSNTRREKLEKVMAKFLNPDFMGVILDAMQADDVICINEFNDLFNRDPCVLPCANGMLDFRTLEIRPLQREDYVTFKATARWDPEAQTEGAVDFLKSLWPINTTSMVKFVSEWLGYCLTGLTAMQILVFMIGYGSNGKSKLSKVMENILGPVAFAHVSYEALCQKGTGPNEEIYAARLARMWQVDENDGKNELNMIMIKKISGEDSIQCRQLYGHTVKVPARAKLNFAVNKPPKLEGSSDIKEQTSTWRRFVYINCPMQFVDFGPNSKDGQKIEMLRKTMAPDEFNLCVRQVDINLDRKLETMTSGFLRVFAEAVHRRFSRNEDGTVSFKQIEIPPCVQNEVSRMMRANPSLRADDFLNAVYEPGTAGEVFMRDMFVNFLRVNDLEESNFSYSRFEADVDRWCERQNSSHPNVRQSQLLVRRMRILRGARKGETIVKNVTPNTNVKIDEI